MKTELVANGGGLGLWKLPLLVGVIVPVLMGSGTVLAQTTPDLFRITFRATGRAFDDSTGQVAIVYLTETNIVSQCVGRSDPGLMREFALAYNASENKIQVVTATDGALICDVAQFLTADFTSDSNSVVQFAFMFVPDQTNAIGTAIIGERGAATNTGTPRDRANIAGQLQFALSGDTTLGGAATNFTGTGTNLASVPSGQTNPGPTSGISTGTNSAMTDTNGLGIGTNTITNPGTNALTGVTNSGAIPGTVDVGTGTALALPGSSGAAPGTALGAGSIGLGALALTPALPPAISTNGTSAVPTVPGTNTPGGLNATNGPGAGGVTNGVISVPSNTVPGTVTGLSGTRSIFFMLSPLGQTNNSSNIRIYTGMFRTARRIVPR